MLKVLVPLLLVAHLSQAQFIENPSFEGPPKASQSPPGWSACNNFSTPDTQPGTWNVSLAPSDGQTYISLVTRGLNGEPKDDSREAIGIPFKKDFTLGVTYKISVDLAFANNFDDLWYYPYWSPVVLKMYGGNSECEQTTLLWVSPTISNTGWVTYDFDYTPTQLYKYLILEAHCTTDVGDKPYNGNILVDNIVIKDPVVIEEPEEPGPDHTLVISKACKLGVPNVFTPNSDEWNEKFAIQYNSNVARFNLNIYNRWGALVFQSSDIDQIWDGRTVNGNEASTGTYYWVINCLCIENNTILDDNLKGTVSVIR